MPSEVLRGLLWDQEQILNTIEGRKEKSPIKGNCALLISSAKVVPKNTAQLMMHLCFDARGDNCPFLMVLEQKTDAYDVRLKLCMCQFSSCST